MTIKTVLSMLSLVTASGLAVAHHAASDPSEHRPVSAADAAVDAAVLATTQEKFEQTLDAHAALTASIFTDARNRALRLEAEEAEAVTETVAARPTGTYMVQQWQHLKDRAADARFEFKPVPTGRKTKKRKLKGQYIKPGGGGSRYAKYGTRRAKMFQRTRQYDITRKKNRDRDRIGRLRTGISRVPATRRPYVKRQSMFRNSRWGIHADSRYRYRSQSTNQNLQRSRQRANRQRR